MNIQTRTRLWKNEEGLASFLVTFVLMLVITLVTLSFAQIIRREQRQALDRNLSSRAFYAAESGINSAIKALNNGYSTEKTDCRPDGSGDLSAPAYTLDAATGTELNCLTVDNTPKELVYPNLPKGKSLVVPIFPQSSMNRLDVSWQSTTAASSQSYAACVAGNGLTPSVAWNCPAPVLRIDIIDVSGPLDRAGIANRQRSVFLYPISSGGTPTINYATLSSFSMVNARCVASNNPNDCNVVFNMPGSANKYYFRVVSYYTDARLTITPSNGANGVELAGAQAIIDSTGKSQDVTRRLQVRKSLSSIGVVPEFGIDAAAGLCKRYLVIKGNGTPGNSVLNLGTSGTLHDGSPCALD